MALDVLIIRRASDTISRPAERREENPRSRRKKYGQKKRFRGEIGVRKTLGRIVHSYFTRNTMNEKSTRRI